MSAPADAVTPVQGFTCPNCRQAVYLTATTGPALGDLARDHWKECEQ